MSVFISYNRVDEAFADKLSLALVSNQVPVWRDTWKLSVGDSITNSVQNALEKATFVCIIFSKNALKSKWVEREITASLVRELEEKKLTILPVVIDDCTLPLFFRDKLYADFRTDFDYGVKKILNAVGDKYNLFSGEFTNKNTHTSYGTSVLLYENSLEINFDVISQDEDSDYFILTNFKFIGNEKSLEHFKIYHENGDGGKFIREVIEICNNIPDIANTKVFIGGNTPGRKSFNIGAGEDGLAFRLNVSSKKVGPDDGLRVVFNLGALLMFYTE